MTTRSRIGIALPGGKIRSIYCHNDGQLDGVGIMLHEHYRDRAKVQALIELGDLSSLEKEVAPPPNVEHRYEAGHRHPDVTVAYGRDRLKSDVAAITSDSLDDFLMIREEFNYLWTLSDRWRVWGENSILRGDSLTVELVVDSITQEAS